MKFIADLHIHSHYSIATSRQLTPEYLDYWARIKGINVVGTGDFTHPKWLEELKEKLVPAEPGLFKLKEKLHIRDNLPPSFLQNPIRFMLTTELSSIYKKKGETRKVHSLIFSPCFEVAEKINRKLSGLGFNIISDGRPILGLDPRDLLELSLEISPQIFFVPAHIWTPWFSILGSKSGFDSVTECFEDLSPHIHAIETGLSSDPPMNRSCSFLDNHALISNSDAHSPEKLGREANIFNTEMDFHNIVEAIKSKNPVLFPGTIEMFPQEGKYYFDGHRKCDIRWHPETTSIHSGICPRCGNDITKGVLNRIKQLADREKPTSIPKPSFYSVISLKDILSGILGKGPRSKTVNTRYHQLIHNGGPELHMLLEASNNELIGLDFPKLAERIIQVREKKISIIEGFDGEFGKISIQSPLGSEVPDSIFGIGFSR